MQTRLTQLLNIELPIVQAPMAGGNDARLAIEVSEAGGLGSLPCGMLSADRARDALRAIRGRTQRPVNLNFFCHVAPMADAGRQKRWRESLMTYYRELGLESEAAAAESNRAPFDDAMCEVVEEFRPTVVSFHFGLPSASLVERVRATGATILSSATSVDEARWLEDHGCDVVIAQGAEAGGHRGMFLTTDPATQIGTIALVPLVVDAVSIPVIATGGITDARGIAAALMLGADAVQIGTRYLLCPEATTTAVHREALMSNGNDVTAITNVFTGRPARGLVNRAMRELGPLSRVAPEYPLAAIDLGPLRAKAESMGSGDFSPLWSGEAAPLARTLPAGALTRQLAAETADHLQAMARKYA